MTANINYEKIAEQIHEFYRELMTTNNWPNVFAQSYADLPEFMKEDNRQAARRIGDVLAAAGLRLVQREGADWSDDEQSQVRAMIEDNLEILAEAEHDGWVEARRRHGWKSVATKAPSLAEKRENAEQRLQHLLIPYESLEEPEKKKDRDSVRSYVNIISRTEYRIAPQT